MFHCKIVDGGIVKSPLESHHMDSLILPLYLLIIVKGGLVLTVILCNYHLIILIGFLVL